MASTKVVLPAPLGPINPTSSPGSTSRSTSTTAWTPPNDTEMFRADRTVTAHPADASERAPASERPATACVAGERSERSSAHPGHHLLPVVVGCEQRARFLLAGGG